MAHCSTDGNHDSARIKIELQQLCNSIQDYAHAHPAVTGIEKMLKRAQSDLMSVSKLHASRQEQQALGEVSTNHTADGPMLQRLQVERLHGVKNNLRGLQAELAVAKQAPGVICLGTRFYASVSAGE